MLTKSLIVIALFAVCLQLATTKPLNKRREGSHHEKSKFLGRRACKIVNGTETTNKTCGCGDEAGDVECSVGPLSLTDKGGNKIQATFCATEKFTSPRRPTGVFKAACRYEHEDNTIFWERPCRNESLCGSDSNNFISTQINEVDVKAFFCDVDIIDTEHEPKSRKNDEDSSASSESDEDSASSVETPEEGADDEEAAQGENEGEQQPLTADVDDADDDDDKDCVPLSKRPKRNQDPEGRPKGGQDLDARPQGGQERNARPQGGQARNARPQDGQERNVRPQGGQERNARLQHNQEREGRPQPDQERDIGQNGRQNRNGGGRDRKQRRRGQPEQ